MNCQLNSMTRNHNWSSLTDEELSFFSSDLENHAEAALAYYDPPRAVDAICALSGRQDHPKETCETYPEN